MPAPEITVCVPTIQPRRRLLERALASIREQHLPPTNVIVMQDERKHGAAITRQYALDQVTTEWVAFLDDDDEMYPQHLDVLARTAHETGADYVFSWFDVIGGEDPFPTNFGRVFDPCEPHQTTITVLCRTEVAQDAGFLTTPKSPLLPPDGNHAGEDWRFTLRCIELGAHIVHVPQRTWAYHHDSGNTSGLPERWHLDTSSVSFARF